MNPQTLTTIQTQYGDSLVLTCSGSAETEQIEALRTAIDLLHANAMQSSAQSVVADIRDVAFASSSCLKVFVTWLQRVQELDDARRYKIVFRSNPRHSWQRRSLSALAAFAAGVVEVTEEAP